MLKHSVCWTSEMLAGFMKLIYQFKDIHKENISSNKTKTLTESMNMNIWEIGTFNQLLIRDSYTPIKFSKKWSSAA